MEAGRKEGRPLRAAAARALTASESRERREDSHTKIGRTHSQNQEELWKTLSKTVGDHCATLTPLYLRTVYPVRPDGCSHMKGQRASRDLRLENNFYFFFLDSNVVQLVLYWQVGGHFVVAPFVVVVIV